MPKGELLTCLNGLLPCLLAWTVVVLVGGKKLGLDQQVTKESQDLRGGTWPPPAVFDMPEPVSYLQSFIRSNHPSAVRVRTSMTRSA